MKKRDKYAVQLFDVQLERVCSRLRRRFLLNIGRCQPGDTISAHGKLTINLKLDLPEEGMGGREVRGRAWVQRGESQWHLIRKSRNTSRTPSCITPRREISQYDTLNSGKEPRPSQDLSHALPQQPGAVACPDQAGRGDHVGQR